MTGTDPINVWSSGITFECSDEWAGDQQPCSCTTDNGGTGNLDGRMDTRRWRCVGTTYRKDCRQ